MTHAYRVDTLNRPPTVSGDLAISLDLLINGALELPEPHGPERDVLVVDGQRYRPVRWDIEAQALICWRVP